MAKPRKLIRRLPATPCTPEMHERVLNLAGEMDVSIADLQRRAISLFLRRHDKKFITQDELLTRKAQPS